MRIIDEKGKLFGTINIVDFTVLVSFFVFVSMIYLGYKMMTKDAGRIYKEAKIQVKCIKIIPELTNFIKVGDVEKDSSGKIIGRITSIEILPSESDYIKRIATTQEADKNYTVLNLRGNIMVMPTHDNINMTVGIALICNMEKDDLHYAGQPVSVGKEFTFSTNLYTVAGYVINLELT